MNVVLMATVGHWAHALRELGTDILAFDNDSTEQPGTTKVTKVLKGDETVLKWYPQRTLLMVYPPETEMASKCLEGYSGDYLLYVGEARGGVNGTDKFFSDLEAEFECIHIEELDPFPRCYERLFVLRRKRENRKPKPWWSPLASWW